MKTIIYENYDLIIISSDTGTQNNNIAMSIKNNFINDSDEERTKYQTFWFDKNEQSNSGWKKLPINGKSLEHI